MNSVVVRRVGSIYIAYRHSLLKMTDCFGVCPLFRSVQSALAQLFPMQTTSKQQNISKLALVIPARMPKLVNSRLGCCPEIFVVVVRSLWSCTSIVLRVTGWWYMHCQYCNLNGRYSVGVVWFNHDTDDWMELSATRMKISRTVY